MKKRVSWKSLFFILFIVYSVAFIGSIFTSSNVNTGWYDSVKPSITPPNFVFPIVWNILFFLIALSLFFAWNSSDKKGKIRIGIAFWGNLLFNVLWSFLFFSLKLPIFSFFELVILLLPSILAMIFIAYKINRLSSYLLIPYLIWVMFASYLNYLIAFQ